LTNFKTSTRETSCKSQIPQLRPPRLVCNLLIVEFSEAPSFMRICGLSGGIVGSSAQARTCSSPQTRPSAMPASLCNESNEHGRDSCNDGLEGNCPGSGGQPSPRAEEPLGMVMRRHSEELAESPCNVRESGTDSFVVMSFEGCGSPYIEAIMVRCDGRNTLGVLAASLCGWSHCGRGRAGRSGEILLGVIAIPLRPCNQ